MASTRRSITEPLLVTFDAATNRFWCRTREAGSWCDFSQAQPEIAKPFFVVLMVLRELTPLTKATPFPAQRLRDKNGKWLIVAGVRRAAAKLAAARDTRMGCVLYLLQDIYSGDVFARPSAPKGQYLEEGKSWSAVDPGIVRKKLADDALLQAYEIGNEKGPEAAITSYEEMAKEFEVVEEPRVREVVATARYNRGVTLGQLGRNDEAIAEYDRVFAAAKNSPEPSMQEMAARTLLAKAFSLDALGRGGEAVEVYRTLLASFGNSTAPEMQRYLNRAREALS